MSDFPSGKYRTIYIDPPWPERGGAAKSNAERTSTTV